MTSLWRHSRLTFYYLGPNFLTQGVELLPGEVWQVSKRNSQYFRSYLRKTTGGPLPPPGATGAGANVLTGWAIIHPMPAISHPPTRIWYIFSHPVEILNEANMCVVNALDRTYRARQIVFFCLYQIGENGGAPPLGEHRPPKYNKK